MKAAEIYEKLDSIHQLVKAHEDPDGNVLVDEVRVNVVLDFLDMENLEISDISLSGIFSLLFY